MARAAKLDLRTFQQELAARLASKTAAQVESSRLGLSSGGDQWLVRLGDAGEVVALPQVTPVPHTHPWHLGVANVRGNLYSVVDFSAFLGGAPAVRSDSSRLLLISDKYRVGCALLIDAVVGLRNPQLFVLANDAPVSAPWISAHYTDRDKQLWSELGVERLAQDPEFLDICARPS